jgi:hypothetical protein
MHLTTQLIVRLGLVSGIGILGACGGGDLVLPDPSDGGQNVALSKFAGDSQAGTVGQQLPAPLIVQVLTQFEQPAVSRKVVFESSDPAAGRVTPDTAVTGNDGQALARWTLGTTPGSHTVVARLVDGAAENQSAEFTAAAQAAAPDTIVFTTPLTRIGRMQQLVVPAPAVHVVDRYGNPVAGTPVAWQVTAGDGQVEVGITDTDIDGNASAQWTLGNRIGIQRLTAGIGNVTGSPVTFTATVFF